MYSETAIRGSFQVQKRPFSDPCVGLEWPEEATNFSLRDVGSAGFSHLITLAFWIFPVGSDQLVH